MISEINDFYLFYKDRSYRINVCIQHFQVVEYYTESYLIFFKMSKSSGMQIPILLGR